MNEQSLWYLENIDVRGIFCPKKMGKYNESHEQKKYKKGTYIYMPDDQADKIFFLTEGRIKIGTYGDSGKEITKTVLGPGEVFGELALTGEQNRRDFALVMEDAFLCALNKNDLQSMLKDHSALNLFMMKIMGNRVLEMEKRLESLVFKDSRTRIIEFLLNLVHKRGQRVGYEMLVRKFFTHQEIAKRMFTQRCPFLKIILNV